MVLDAAGIFAAYFVPLILRFGGDVPDRYWGTFWVLWPVLCLVHLLANYFFGLYGEMWRYASIQEARRVLLSGAVAAPIVLAIPVVLSPDLYLLPRPVVALGAVLSVAAIGTVRFQSRLFGFRRREVADDPTRIIVVGAGEAGAMLLVDLEANRGLGLEPVALVDDDPRTHGRFLRGIRVVGGRQAIPALVRRLRVDEVLLAIPSATSDLVQQIASLCEEVDVPLRVLPSKREVLGGRVGARDIRDLRIEDLLGRRQVETDLELVAGMIRDRVVLITGAGGSIGAEITRQVLSFDPASVVVLDHDETHLHDLLVDVAGGAGVVPVLADVRDRDRLLAIFDRHDPNIVFHAAAHKHVPILERFPEEAVLTNVIGTANAADASLVCGAERFVLISTDKAVNTTNVMGASKWLAEEIVRSLDKAPCTFTSVRFGNVLGSRGSVIPTFLRQIARGGPVTVTDTAMTRYFMSSGEAVQLVLQAAALARGGEVFTLEMGSPMNIFALAQRVIRLSGRAVGTDVRIDVVGSRPGEKLTEELVAEGEELVDTPYAGIRVARGPRWKPADLRAAIGELESLARAGSAERLSERMIDLASRSGAAPRGIGGAVVRMIRVAVIHRELLAAQRDRVGARRPSAHPSRRRRRRRPSGRGCRARTPTPSCSMSAWRAPARSRPRLRRLGARIVLIGGDPATDEGEGIRVRTSATIDTLAATLAPQLVPTSAPALSEQQRRVLALAARGPDRPADRARAGDQPEDRRAAQEPHLPEARRPQPGGRRARRPHDRPRRERRMNPMDYVKAVRRRWVDVVLAVVVALAIGFAFSSVAPTGPVTQTYESTAVLLATGDFYTPGAGNLQALATLTTVGDVPERVAERIDYRGDPVEIASQVETRANTQAGLLEIKATSTDEAEAEQLSSAFGEELIAFLQQTRTESVSTQRETLERQLEEQEDAIRQKQQELASAPPSAKDRIQGELDALNGNHGLLYESYQQLATSNASTVGLDIVEPGFAVPLDQGGIQPPQSLVSRLVLAGLLGLISGIVIVLLLDRFDTRIRTRKAAEEHFGVPVLAEIPFLSKLRRKRASLTLEQEPRAPAADAFRMLATMLSMPTVPTKAPVINGNGNGNGNGGRGAEGLLSEPAGDVPAAAGSDGEAEAPRTILITSPGPSDGKTTVTGNLAIAFAQLGKRVLVLSCDLRRPSIHRLFGIENEHGFAERLASRSSDPVLQESIQATRVPGVWIVPSGPPPNAPGQLLASPEMRRALSEARAKADVTIIDTAPILTTSDAANLVPHVDSVVLVGRAGRTTQEVARQTTEVLGRLGGRIRGVVLNAAAESSVPRRYYYYRYYRAQRPKAGKGSPRLARHSAGD